MVVERVRAVLQLLRKRQRTAWAVERSDRARTHGCAPRRGFSLREIARREGRCQRRPSDPAARGERCEHMNEVTILAPNEVVEQLEASERLPQDIDPDTLRKYFTLTRPDLALLTTLNERLKSGDVTVSHARRWSDFEEYLIPR